MQWPQRVQAKGAVDAALAAALVALGCAAPTPIAAQEARDSNPAAVFGNPTSGSLAQQRGIRDGFIGARDFEAALGPARAIVAAQETAREPEYAVDLARLGMILGELRRTDEAETELLEAVEIVEGAEGPYSPTLVDYYRSLGRAYIKGAQYPKAIATLEQAQHISQRNLGLFNVEQAALLDDITTAYLGLGDTLEARNVQLERLDNAVRRFGAGDPRVIPFRYVLADYYQRSRLPESAREQYEEVLKSQETRLGGRDPELLAPLRELAGIDLLLSQGAEPTHRDRLVELLANGTEIAPAERGLSLELLGDWATVRGDADGAREYYRQAWEALGSQPEIDVANHFAKPVMLDFVAPISQVDRAERRRPYTWGAVVLEFDVSAEGLPSDVHIASRDERAAPVQARYLRRLRETHFRPRLIEGVPTATANVRATHYVRYYVEDEE